MVVQNAFDLKYDFDENRYFIYKNDVKFNKLKSKDLRFPKSSENVKGPKPNYPFGEFDYGMLRCLKIKQQRLREVEKHPITTPLLSVITCIGIGIIFIPWAIVAFFDGHLGCRFVDFSQRLFNKIRPVFIKKHLQKRIEKDRKILIKSITEIDRLYTQDYVNNLQQKHQKYVEKYGETLQGIHLHVRSRLIWRGGVLPAVRGGHRSCLNVGFRNR